MFSNDTTASEVWHAEDTTSAREGFRLLPPEPRRAPLGLLEGGPSGSLAILAGAGAAESLGLQMDHYSSSLLDQTLGHNPLVRPTQPPSPAQAHSSPPTLAQAWSTVEDITPFSLQANTLAVQADMHSPPTAIFAHSQTSAPHTRGYQNPSLIPTTIQQTRTPSYVKIRAHDLNNIIRMIRMLELGVFF